jgi:hypothetical protein
MSNKIQGTVTSIYDWLDINPAFKIIDRASHYCSTERFLYHAAELHSLLTQARTILNSFSNSIEKIDLCLSKLHGEIDREVAKKRITKEQLDLLLRDGTVQIKIKDLLTIAKRLQRFAGNTTGEKLKNSNSMFFEDVITLSNLIITKFGEYCESNKDNNFGD